MRKRSSKKPIPLTEYRVTAPLWGFWGRVLVGGTYEDLQKFLDTHHRKGYKLYNDEQECEDQRIDNPHAAGMEFYVKDGNDIVFYAWADRYSLPIISHELQHMTWEMLHFAGIKLSLEAEEAYTYLHEDLLEQVIRLMFRVEARPKKLKYKSHNSLV